MCSDGTPGAGSISHSQCVSDAPSVRNYAAMLAESASRHHSLGSTGQAMQQPPANLAGLGLAANIGYPELALLSSLGAGLMPGGAHHPQFGVNSGQNKQMDLDDRQTGSRGGRTRSGDSRSSSAYASRHQAAEQRRRTRINERLELLRKLVPHAERANTACFLEEVIKYVELLKSRNASLEKMIKELQAASGNAAATAPALVAPSPAAPAAAAPDSSTLPVLSLTVPPTADLQQQGAAGAAETQLVGAQLPAQLQSQPSNPAAAAAAALPTAQPAAGTTAPPSTRQALQGLQGLLPEGIDVQMLLQQALINAQAQLLQQHQQHQAALQQATSNVGPAASAGGAANPAAATTSTAGNQQQQGQQQTQCLAEPQPSQPILAAPPSLVLQLPVASAAPAPVPSPAAPQASILSTLSEPRQQLVPTSELFAAPAAKPPSPTPIIPGSTLPTYLQELWVKVDPNARATAAETGAGTSASSSAAGLTGTGGSLSSAMTSAMPAAMTMGMIGLGGMAGLTGFKGPSNGSFPNNAALLSAVAAAGAAENAAVNALVERQQAAAAAAAAAASAAEDGDDEKSVPHKKRKMLVL